MKTELKKLHDTVCLSGKVIYEGEGVTYKRLEDWRVAKSEGYNYIFNEATGFFVRWGVTFEEDPSMSPHNEILDLEITTICKGPNNKVCNFCYKENLPDRGHNMSFEEFKNLIDKMPWLTQVALGADAHGTTNPDMFKMMEYARSKGITPNLTIAQVSKEVAEKLAKVAGAIAVSVYPHAGKCIAYDSVKILADAGMKQINLHYMVSKQSLPLAYEVTRDLSSDSRLESVNAIVFLSLKQKGRGTRHEMATQVEFKDLVTHCLDNDISFGFDSCSAPAFMESIKTHKDFEKFKQLAEPCESSRFSSYINERGVFFPCSFTEGWGEGGWSEGIDVLAADTFLEVWNSPRVTAFKEMMIANTDANGCENCPAYEVCSRSGYLKAWDGEYIDIINMESL